MQAMSPRKGLAASDERRGGGPAGAIGLALALGIPLVLFLLDGDWPYTNPFSPPWFDPFVYQSLFMHPHEAVTAHPNYYPATRIPLVALGSAFYAALPPVAANLALKFALFASTLGIVFYVLRRAAGLAAAIATTILLGAYPYYVMSVGWDYLEGLVCVLLSLCYLGATLAAQGRVRWRLPEVLIGAALGTLLACNLFTLVFAPVVAIYYVAALARAGRLGLAALVQGALAAALGGLAALVVLSLLNMLLGGEPLVLAVQIRTALELSNSSGTEAWSIRYSSWSHLQPYAIWVAVPFATGLLALLVGAAAAVRAWRGGFGREDVFAALVALHFLLALGLFVLSTAVSLAVLMLWFYTNYLIVSTFVTLGIMLGYLARGTRRVPAWPLVGLALIVFAVHLPAIGLPLQNAFGFGFGSVKLAATLPWVVAGVLLLGLAALPRARLLAVPAAALLAVGYVSMITQPQLNFVQERDRESGFRAIVAASAQVDALSNNPRRFIWADRSEPRVGGLFHAISIRAVPISHNWAIDFGETVNFPTLPPHGLKAADPVIIFTARPDWQQRANESLAKVDLAFVPDSEREIAYGQVRFQAIVGHLVSGGAGSRANLTLERQPGSAGR